VDTNNDLFDTDIPWSLSPAPKDVPSALDPSTPDLVGMLYADYLTLEAHLSSVQADLACYRELVQRALDQVSDLTAVVQKQNVRLTDQSRQLRELMGIDAA
jgi:hypothetical protein